MAAVRFYRTLAPEFAGWRVPPLATLETTASAEVVELIERHSRVVPREKTLELLQGAFEGKITRRALQDSWRIHQPLLVNNRRGRQRAGQRREPVSVFSQTASSALEAEVAVFVARSPLDWLEVKPHRSKLFVAPKVTLPTSDGDSSTYMPHIVIVVQKAETVDAHLHGVEVVCSEAHSRKIKQLNATARNFDYFWVAFHGDPAHRTERFSDDMGFLSVLNGAVNVVRPAQRMCENLARSGQLAARLLAAAT